MFPSTNNDDPDIIQREIYKLNSFIQLDSFTLGLTHSQQTQDADSPATTRYPPNVDPMTQWTNVGPASKTVA